MRGGQWRQFIYRSVRSSVRLLQSRIEMSAPHRRRYPEWIADSERRNPSGCSARYSRKGSSDDQAFLFRMRRPLVSEVTSPSSQTQNSPPSHPSRLLHTWISTMSMRYHLWRFFPMKSSLTFSSVSTFLSCILSQWYRPQQDLGKDDTNRVSRFYRHVIGYVVSLQTHICMKSDSINIVLNASTRFSHSAPQSTI